MTIAILAAVSPGGEQGGAERFYQGLQAALERAGASAEILTVVSDESSFEAIKESYLRYYDLDLAGYEGVISTKAPGYIVRHPNHVCYLQHTMRVFYDMFELEFPQANQDLIEQRAFIRQLDTAALQPPRTRRIFTIGHQVRQRLLQFNGLDSEVLYQASTLHGFHCGEYRYVFMPGRLHRWKRVDLAIKAMRYVRAPIELLITGTGEDEEALRRLAAGDSRIHFLGRVTDDELLNLYADALVVPFAPLREDFGLVTLEAFHSAKPVITCRDSGEPATLVLHEQTGFICEPEPQALAERIEQLVLDPTLAAKMGRQGEAFARRFTWENVAATLLAALDYTPRAGKPAATRSMSALAGAVQSNEPAAGSLKITVLDMQPIDPPVGGGRLRLLGLYHALGEQTQATYVGTYDWPGPEYRQHWLSPTLEEIDVPLSPAHFAAAAALRQQTNGKTVIDAAFHQQAHLSPDYVDTARRAAQQADVVVFSHPWVWPLVADLLTERKPLIVYDSHNVEGLLRLSLLDDGGVGAAIAREVVRIEYELCRAADLVLACSNDDKNLFNRLYRISHKKIRVAPNGVFINKIKPATSAQKAQAQKQLQLKANHIALFIGSDYKPNIEAARFIVTKLAAHMPDIDFIILGGAGTALTIPYGYNNVYTPGAVSEEMKTVYLTAADIAINPMHSGSGTNIKMFEFMAAGLPIVSSEVGARGIPNSADKSAFIISSLESFADALRKLMNNESLRIELGLNARAYAEKDFAWESISPRLGNLLLNEFRIRPKKNYAQNLIIMSSLGATCGIAEYTRYLVDGLTHVTSPPNISLITTHEYNHSVDTFQADPIDYVVNAWNFDNKNWVDSKVDLQTIEELISEIKPWRFNLQYHPGFFGLEILTSLLKIIRARDIKCSITLHNSRELTQDHIEILNMMQVVSLVHTLDEAHQLKSRGLEAVQLVPHGVIEFQDEPIDKARVAYSIRGEPVIATFGFLRPYKGTKNLIEAVKLLKAKFPNIHLMALTALYPSRDSEEYFRACIYDIQQFGLSHNVTLVTDYLPPDEVLKRLHTADIIVLPYEEVNEGASGAATFAIACRRPVVITPSAAFIAFRSVAYQANNNTPEELASTIQTLLLTPSLTAALKQQVSDYADQHAWRRIAQNFLDHQLKF